MKIYTRSGDEGETGLYDGTRISKDALRVECYGTIDELNSCLGFACNFIDDPEIKKIIRKIQRKLFDVAGELAVGLENNYAHKINEDNVTYLEHIIDTYLEKVPDINAFILPGTNKPAGALHVARTVCRRAERRIITLNTHESVSPVLLKYMNRLSDAIYMIARYLEDQHIYIDFNAEED